MKRFSNSYFVPNNVPETWGYEIKTWNVSDFKNSIAWELDRHTEKVVFKRGTIMARVARKVHHRRALSWRGCFCWGLNKSLWEYGRQVTARLYKLPKDG